MNQLSISSYMYLVIVTDQTPLMLKRKQAGLW